MLRSKEGKKIALSRHSKCLVAIVVAVLTSQRATPQDLSPLEHALNNSGYKLYKPPRENWGPGFVFAGDVTNGKITNVREICPNLYADLEAPQSSAILLPDFDAKDSFSFGLALHFMKGLLGLNADLDKVQREQSISVKWNNLRENSYADMDKWLDSGELRPIAKRCRLAIEDLRARKLFDGRVFVIVRAVAPESLVFDFEKAIEAKGSASAEVWEQGKAKLEGNAEVKNHTQLEIKKKLYIGYAPPVKLEEWVESGLKSGEILKVRGRSSPLPIE